MRKVRSRRSALAVGAAAAVVTAFAPATASAVNANVTGDDGNSTPIVPGLTLRNMDAKVGVDLAANEGYVNTTVTGPDGAQAQSPRSCLLGSPSSVDYRGNGTYTVTVQVFAKSDFLCKTPLAPPSTYQYTVNATVTLAGPPQRVLTRNPNTFATNTVNLPISTNPGNLTTEVRYAAGAAIGPDGGISGPSDSAYVNSTTGTVPLSLGTPGTYTVVARDKGYGGTGQYYTPWSAPVTVTAVAPFDLSSVTFPDSRGPSYSLRGSINEDSTRGYVYIDLGRGTTGKYRYVGKAKISSKATFVKRFRVGRTGRYRVRYRFKGSSTVAAGFAVQKIRITRRIFFN